MAVPGRCAGCGKAGNASRIDRHTLECGEFQRLYAHDPQAALGAAEEHARWERDSKAGRRLERRDTALAATRTARAIQAQRFARLPDVLADE